MTTPYIQNLRAALGSSANDISDEELVSMVAQSTGRNPAEVADAYRVAPTTSGQWGSRFGGSIDAYQSNLYDVGRAASSAVGLPGAASWMDRQRSANAAQAEIQRARAQNQGAIMSYQDVGGVGDALNYVGGLAVDSAPYIAEAAVGGIAGRLARGAAAGRGASAIGAAAASYPSAVGDIMSSQREQAGVTDDAAAAMYGVPYAALNAISPVERLAAGAGAARAPAGMLARGEGFRAGLGRVATNMGVGAVGEGLNEVGQEVFNQAGRMAVDPDAALFDEAARARYAESFVGGAALGGLTSGAAGGWRRPQQAPLPTDPAQPVDLLNGRPEFSLQSYSAPAVPEYEAPAAPAGPAEVDPRQMSLFSGVQETVSGRPVELTSDELNTNSLPFVSEPLPQAELTSTLGAGTPAQPQARFGNEIEFQAPASSPQLAGIPGEQANIFGGYDLPESQAGQTDEDVGMSGVDARQRDMFAEQPTAAVGTDFPLARIRRQMLGATKGKIDSWTVRLAKSLSDSLADPVRRDALLEEAEEQLMTFDGAVSTYDKRERALNEAKNIAQLYDQRLADARAQEGVAQADVRGLRATRTVSPAASQALSTNSAPVVREQGQRAMGELRAESALETTDNRVADAAKVKADRTRAEILDRVLDDPKTRNPLSRFYAELKRAGITDTNIRPEEVERTDRWEAVKAGLSEPDTIPSTPNELDVYAPNDTAGRSGAAAGVAQRPGAAGRSDQRAGMAGVRREPAGAREPGRGPDAEPPVAGDAAPVLARSERVNTPVNPSSPESVGAEAASLFPAAKLARRVTVVPTFSALPADVRESTQAGANTLKAVTVNGDRIYMVADKIERGAARGVLMHELGVHVGMDASMVRRLTEQVMDWTKRSDSVGDMARAAVQDAARSSSTDVSDEVVAYMVERLVNSGIDPTQVKPTNPVSQFLKLVYNALRAAARRFGINVDTLTPQDVVDFAYGAAGAALDRAPTPRSEGVSYSEADYSLPDPKKMPAFSRLWEDTLGTWRANPNMLGWYTNRQLGEKFPFAKQIADGIGRMGAKAKSLMAQSHAVDMAWGRLSDEQATALHKAMIESTMANMHVVDPTSDAASPKYVTIKYENGKPVWGDERSRELNGHMKLDEDGNLAKFQKLLAQFKALDKDQLGVYLDAQRKLRADFDAHNALFRQNVARAYDRGLARYMSDTKTNPAFDGLSTIELASLNRTEQKRLMARPEWSRLSRVARKDVQAMWHDVNTQEERSSQMRGPYFPLTRFGDHIVVVKSTRYSAAQEEVANLQKQLEVMSTFDADTPEQAEVMDSRMEAKRQEILEARERVEAMRDNPADYQVEFFERRSEAVAREKFVRDEWIPGSPERSDMTVERLLRTQYNSSLDSMSEGFVNKLEEQLTATLPAKEIPAVRDALRSIYLQQLPDRSALKSMLKRQNVAGVKTAEMRRAFASATLRNAWRLSRMEHSNDIKSAIDELRQSRGEDARIVGDEFGKRFLTSIQLDEESPLLDTLANAGYIWHLAASPAYLLTNLTQPWTTSLPMMASRAGGPRRAASALTTATQQVVKNMIAAAKKDGARFEVNLDGEDFTQGERDMLKNLLNQGLIDVTLEHDLGNVAKGKEETLGGKIMRYAAWPAHQTEVVNRVATALAAYRIAQGQPGTSQAEAMTYAEDIVASTHFDYSAENAARLMRPGSLGGLGRLVFQFKKYTQAMIYLLGSNAKKAFQGDREAAKSLAYLLGFQMAVSGMVGFPAAPLASLISKALASAWDDDDEPDFYMMAYNGMKDAVGETAARALMKGLPAAAGLDLSGSVGMQGLMNPFAFADTQGKTGGDWAAAMMFSLAGPAPALIAKGWDSAKALQDGDPLKAAELAAPRVAAAMLKGFAMADKGITDRRGNVLMSPEEVGTGAAALRALGFQSTPVGDMYESRNAFYDAKTAKIEVRKRLLRDMVRAQTPEELSEVRQEVVEFNSRHPENAIKPKDVNAAKRDARNSLRETQGGVRVRKQDQPLARELGIID